MPLRVVACASLLIVVLSACAAAQVRTDVPTDAPDQERVSRELELLRSEMERQANQDTSSRADWWMVGITGLTSLGAVITLVVLWRQTKAAVLSAQAADKSAKAAMLAQRAYVDVSHTPEGLTIEDATDAGHRLSVRFHIKNHGRTPADVFSLRFGVLLGPTWQLAGNAALRQFSRDGRRHVLDAGREGVDHGDGATLPLCRSSSMGRFAPARSRSFCWRLWITQTASDESTGTAMRDGSTDLPHQG